MNTRYGFGKIVKCAFDEAVERTVNALQAQGFGVLTDVDVAATMKKKLNASMPPYRILGACNPSLAFRAIEVEPSIGLLLPCNVVVRNDVDGMTHVEIMDPYAVLELVGTPAVAEIALEVRGKLEKVLAAI